MIGLNLLAHPIVIKTLLIGGLIIGGVGYYKYNKAVREKLELLVTTQETRIKDQQAAITGLIEDYSKIVSARNKLNESLRESQESIKKLEDKLFRENQGKSSLEELSRKKPGLVENIINSATKKTFDCLENVTKDIPCEQ